MKLFRLLGALSLLTVVGVHAQSLTSKIDAIGVSRYVHITGIKQRDVSGLINLEVELANFSRAQREIFYRVRWLDTEGFQAWQDEAWKPLLLNGDQKLHIAVVAPSKKAIDYRIEFSAEDNRARKPRLTN